MAGTLFSTTPLAEGTALRCARAIFDPSTNAGERTQTAHGLGVIIPINAWLVMTWYDVVTDFHDGVSDLATIALHVQSAGDLRAATAVVSNYTAGKHQGAFSYGNSPQLKLTAAREITATVAVQNLTAGKMAVYVLYLEGV